MTLREFKTKQHMSQTQIPSPKVKLRDSVILGKVTDIEKLDNVITSNVDILRENIIVTDDFNRKTALEYWLDTDALIALSYSDDGKTLYALVVTTDKTLMLLVFDVIQ